MSLKQQEDFMSSTREALTSYSRDFLSPCSFRVFVCSFSFKLVPLSYQRINKISRNFGTARVVNPPSAFCFEQRRPRPSRALMRNVDVASMYLNSPSSFPPLSHFLSQSFALFIFNYSDST